jgi:hypothetical protein
MAKDDPPLPSFSGTEDSLYGSFRRERAADRPGGFKREHVNIRVGGPGFLRGGVFSSGGLRLQFVAALALSIAAGSVAGAILGGRTGVKPGLEAGARVDTALLAQAPPAKTEGVPQTEPVSDVTRLLDDVRGLRAQIEQLRHAAETARTADHLRAQEAARDVSLEAQQQALDQTTAALAAKLNEIDGRLARLERSGVDTTPVGSIGRPSRAQRGEKGRARKAQ